MNPLEIHFHPTCASSYRLVKHLHGAGILGRVRLLDVSLPGPSGAMYGVWSVPWIVMKGRPVATDPIKPEEVEEFVLTGRMRPPRHTIGAFVRTLIHSMFASALVYLHRSLEPVMDPSFISAAVRTPAGGPDPGGVIDTLRRKEEEVLDRWMGDVAYTLAVGYVRTAYWASGRVRGEPAKEEVASWLLSTASIGRVGLPWRPGIVSDRVGKLVDLIREGKEELQEKVKREQETILRDDEYWEILRGISEG